MRAPAGWAGAFDRPAGMQRLTSGCLQNLTEPAQSYKLPILLSSAPLQRAYRTTGGAAHPARLLCHRPGALRRAPGRRGGGCGGCARPAAAGGGNCTRGANCTRGGSCTRGRDQGGDEGETCRRLRSALLCDLLGAQQPAATFGSGRNRHRSAQPTIAGHGSPASSAAPRKHPALTTDTCTRCWRSVWQPSTSRWRPASAASPPWRRQLR